jgi:acyl-CoA reductase-like NAD-dependent aldehyde dehydrogenase
MGVSITEGTRAITPPNFDGAYGLLIDGNIVQTEDHFDVYNPATNSVLASAPQGTREHMERAIGAAKRAFPAWAALTADEREAIIV